VRLHRSTFNYIEKELYDYPQTKRHLKKLHDDILNSTPPKHEIRSTDVSNPTFYIVSMLTTHKLKLRMEEIIFVIDVAMVDTESRYREAFEDKYWERPSISWTKLSFDHDIPESTLYRLRSIFINKIAESLGMQ